MVKISDIAQKAGVSITTVSRALNNYSDINENTKEKVLAIAKEMGYFPNSSAKALITKKNWLVGILFTESLDVGLEHPLFAGIIEAFKKTMEDHGYDAIFITSKIGNERTSYLNHCKYRNVDGVFVCTYSGWDPMLTELFESDMKCVTTDVAYNENVPIIISDNVKGIEMAYEYLYDLNHRKIAFVSGNQNSISARERLTGYKQILRSKNESFKSNYVTHVNDFDYDSGYKATIELLDKCAENMPTAIIAASDIVAIGAIEALHERGFKVPEDVSIIGFDDIELAKYCKPRLTTVRQSRKKIGNEIALVLLSYIKGEPVSPRTVIPVTIIERETCAPPREV